MDSENNHGIPEFREMDLDDYIPKDSFYEMEKQIRQEIYAKIYEENKNKENETLEIEENIKIAELLGIELENK
jgi:hypothetical protein